MIFPRKRTPILILFIIALTWLSACSSSKHSITYRVSGSAKEAMIEYRDVEYKMVQETVTLPWQMSFDVKESFSFKLYVMNTTGEGDVLCNIIADGNELGMASGSAYTGCTGEFMANADTASSMFTGYETYPAGSTLPQPTEIVQPQPAEIVLPQPVEGESRFIAFSADKELYLLDLETGESAQWTDGMNGASCFSQSPVDARIAFNSARARGNDLYILDYGNPQAPILTAVTKTGTRIYEICPAWSADDSQLVYNPNEGSAPEQVTVINPDGSGITALTHFESGEGTNPAWSPDGKRIAFIFKDSDNFSVQVMNADGSNLTALTEPSQKANKADPFSNLVWSADGTHLAYFYIHDNPTNKSLNSADLILVNLEDGTTETVASLDLWEVSNITWSPDGTVMVIQALTSRTSRDALYSVQMESGELGDVLKQGTDLEDPIFLRPGAITELPASPAPLPPP